MKVPSRSVRAHAIGEFRQLIFALLHLAHELLVVHAHNIQRGCHNTQLLIIIAAQHGVQAVDRLVGDFLHTVVNELLSFFTA